MSEPQGIEFDAQGRIAGDLVCVKCGHNVRGLTPDGMCGECASPVVWSLRGDVLSYRNPLWLASIRRGVAGLALLLPWLWCPLSWPLCVLGLWWLTRDDAASGGRRRITSVTIRAAVVMALAGAVAYGVASSALTLLLPDWVTFSAVLLPPAIILACSSPAVLSILPRGESKTRGLLCVSGVVFSTASLGLLLTCGLLSLADLNGWLAYEWQDYVPIFGSLGLVSLLLAVPLCAAMLAVGWRVIARAETDSRAARRRINAWSPVAVSSLRAGVEARGREDAVTPAARPPSGSTTASSA